MGRYNGEIAEPDCQLCSGDLPADFVETITSASAMIGDEMSPDAFRAWLNDEARQSSL